jgi:hypothetical protein
MDGTRVPKREGWGSPEQIVGGVFADFQGVILCPDGHAFSFGAGVCPHPSHEPGMKPAWSSSGTMNTTVNTFSAATIRPGKAGD